MKQRMNFFKSYFFYLNLLYRLKISIDNQMHCSISLFHQTRKKSVKTKCLSTEMLTLPNNVNSKYILRSNYIMTALMANGD